MRRAFIYVSILLRETKLTLNFYKTIKEIREVLHEEALWKDSPRKAYSQRLYENLIWFIKHGEACKYYNSYGFDIVGFRDKRDYLPYKRFRIERYLEDYPTSIYTNKICILRDKVIFAAYFGNVLGQEYIIPTIGILNKEGTIYSFARRNIIDIGDLFFHIQRPLFVKKLDGECGQGCYRFLTKEDMIAQIDNMRGSTYIIQEQLEQHPDINSINPSCINTIRVITIVGKTTGKPNIFAQYMRVGCNAINDNRATGGVGVSVSTDGRLGEYGVGHHRVEKIHSITGVVYQGRQIPYWDRIKKLVLEAHSAILEIPTIGWDIAITPSGPVLVEGNDNWEISGAQDSNGGLKKKWYELHE